MDDFACSTPHWPRPRVWSARISGLKVVKSWRQFRALCPEGQLQPGDFGDDPSRGFCYHEFLLFRRPVCEAPFVASGLLRLLASLHAKANTYQLAAATVWGVILALVLGIIDYNGTDGKFRAEQHWLLATVGLSAIMYAFLTFLKLAVLAFRKGEEWERGGADD